MNSVKVSIIVPVYNSSAFLAECIESILSQSYTNIQLILVNDGSKDNSLVICNSYLKDNRVIVIDKQNAGVATARNVGLSACDGDYVTFVDSDDTIPATAISSLVAGMVDEVDNVMGQFCWQYGNRVIKRLHRLTTGIHHQNEILPFLLDDGTLSGMMISSNCCTLYRRSIIDHHQLRFIDGLKINEDGLFNFEYFIHSKGVNVVGDHVYTTRKHFGSSTTTRPFGYDYNSIVCNRIKELDWDKDSNDFEIQIARRLLTVLVWDLVLYPRSMSFIEGFKYIKSELKKLNIKGSFSLLQMDKISLYKKILLFFIKHKMYISIYLLTHYAIPFLQTRINR